MMDALALIRHQVTAARREFTGVLADVTSDMANWRPGGVANPIGALVLHTAVGQDRAVQERIQGKPMLLPAWAPRLKVAPEFRLTPEVAKALQTDMAVLRQYLQALDATTDAFLATLKDQAELDRPVQWFRGPMALGDFLIHILVTHVYAHTGEISTLKGLQGATGYARA
jgi:uncharacterized damage-inducible protein DinB